MWGLFKRKSFADSSGRTIKAVENNPHGLRGIYVIDTPAHVSVSPTAGTNFSDLSS